VNTHDVDDRIRAALTAAAEEIHESDLRATRPPTTTTAGPAQHRARWLAPLLAAAAVAAIAVGTAAVITTHSASNKVQPGQTVTPSQLPPAQPTPTRTRSAAVTTQPRSPSVPKASSRGATNNCAFLDSNPGCDFARGAVLYQPLWPFPHYAAEQAWQVASKASGAQPWHLDSRQTALLFAQNYLGYRDIAAVTSASFDNQDAHIGVGYPNPNGQLRTAAVLHLVRYGRTVADATAGWEVVGSDDTDFSLERPAYGSQVSSPMTVGGHITGVDEAIIVSVRTLSGSVETAAALPAGGTNSPWSETVPFAGQGVLTIVASTGGHLTQHERFAIQGVHT